MDSGFSPKISGMSVDPSPSVRGVSHSRVSHRQHFWERMEEMAWPLMNPINHWITLLWKFNLPSPLRVLCMAKIPVSTCRLPKRVRCQLRGTSKWDNSFKKKRKRPAYRCHLTFWASVSPYVTQLVFNWYLWTLSMRSLIFCVLWSRRRPYADKGARYWYQYFTEDETRHREGKEPAQGYSAG